MMARTLHTPAKTKKIQDASDPRESHPKSAHASALTVQPIHGGNRAQMYADNAFCLPVSTKYVWAERTRNLIAALLLVMFPEYRVQGQRAVDARHPQLTRL